MSLDNVVEFWKKVKTDSSLQARVQPGGKVPKLSKDVKASELDELASIAKSAGFDCTAQELAATEAVIRFWGAVPQDAGLKKELAACESMGEQQATAETVKIAAKHGFSFTPEDLSALSPMILASNTGALSDQQLDAVAGGAVANLAVSSSLQFALQGGFQNTFRQRIGPGSVAQYM